MKRFVFSQYFISKLCNHRAFSSKAPPRISDILSKWEEMFLKGDIPEARSSIELITAHVLQRKTLHGVDRQAALCDVAARQIDNLCHKRLTRLPVQYVIGEWDFLCHTLTMRPPVFIPRPETEDLVNLVYESLSSRDDLSTINILDIGTGSGAIIVSLLHLIPDARGVAVDTNDEACRLALENGELIGVADRLNVNQLHLAADKRGWKKLFDDHGLFDVIVSNPPYIPTTEGASLDPEIIRYEDHRALFSGQDGLDFIRLILNNVRCLLKPQG